MKRVFLLIIFIVILLYTSSCNVEEMNNFAGKEIENNDIIANVTPTSMPTEIPSKIVLTKEETENLGIMIKWIYNCNLIHDGDDDSMIQISNDINLLSTDRDKIGFVINIATNGNLGGFYKADSMTYSFTSDYADTIVNYAVGEEFEDHKSYEYLIDYSDGIYSYSMLGADGAMWWPSIEIQSIVSNIEDKISIKGILKSEHDIYTNVYSYNFEAIAIANSESPFGGYTLEELYIK